MSFLGVCGPELYKCGFGLGDCIAALWSMLDWLFHDFLSALVVGVWVHIVSERAGVAGAGNSWLCI